MNFQQNKLIVALDVDNADLAVSLVTKLRDVAGMFKVGSQLFTAEGPQIIRRIIDAGGSIFLDLKFHDIPNTVAAAATEAVRLGVSMFNIHASGGREMMERAAYALQSEALRLGTERPILIGVTVLTSSNTSTLRETGIETNLDAHVQRLAALCHLSGLDGVVASPHEIASIRNAVNDPEFVIVTPGVRPAGIGHDDQKRVMTPGDAIRAGASYIVVGRAITATENPVASAAAILDEMRIAEQSRS
jgi:orotidine-5'-phosphate decarboxylase